MPSVKTIKLTTRRILNKDLFCHIGAMFLIVVCVSSFMITGNVLTTITGDFFGYTAYVLSLFFLYAFTIAMTVPLIFGYAVFETNCVKNGKADFADMFCAFSDLTLYFRSFSVFYALLWRFVIVFAVPAALVYKFISYTNGEKDISFIVGGYDLAYTVYVIIIIAATVASVMVYSRFIISLYITVTRPEKSVSECFYAAKIYRKKCVFYHFSLAVSFLPSIILGIFSLGIAFIYVVPFMLASFFVFAHERYTDTGLDKDITNLIFN